MSLSSSTHPRTALAFFIGGLVLMLPACGPKQTADVGPPTHVQLAPVGPAQTLPAIDEAEPGVVLEPVLCLDPTEQPPGGTPGLEPLLVHEMFRQALLLAGRESLGLATRDSSLREPVPDDLPTQHRLHFAMRRGSEKAPAPTLGQTVAGRRKVRWAGTVPLYSSRVELYPEYLVLAERLSRTEFVEALKRAGFRGQAAPTASAANVPDRVESLLDQMTFPA